MNKLKMIIPLVLLASCNSYYFPLLVEAPQRIISSFKPYSPGESYIKNQESSFVTVELGQQNATLVLSSIENNIFTWVGQGNVTFKTYKGLVIKTSGLANNFTLIDPKYSVDHFLANDPRTLIFNLDKPRLYEVQAHTSKLSTSQSGLNIDLIAKSINWKIKVDITYDDKGMPIATNQTLHPFLGDVTMSYYFKY